MTTTGPARVPAGGAEGTIAAEEALASRSGSFAAFGAPAYPRVFASGALWNLARWMALFAGAYLMRELTGSPLLVQLVGTASFLPMFLGGVAAGAIADRSDRRRTVVRQLGVLIPLAALMAVVVGAGRVEPWMVYVFVAAVGVGNVVDMTNRRAFVHDLVGDRLVGNAMSLEAVSISAGNMAGALCGGAVIAAIGNGSAYGLVAVLYGACFLLMLSVPSAPRRTAATSGTSVRRDVVDGLRALPANRALVSMLGVTFLMNLLFFSYMPLVTVLAERFDAGAFRTGLLASGTGAGMLIGSALVVAFDPKRRGLLYVGGCFSGMACLIAFALVPDYSVALGLLVLTGLCAGGFAATQSALVLAVADESMRGRAMGLLSMAIGALPFGMVILGLLAEATSPSTALVVNAGAGIVALGLWLLYRPDVLHVR
ncbi:MAG: MFS transporter [Acidimicrobiia bacterium]|nr:MFS transporter [Acidimicrobiia bacterium]